MVLVQTNHKQWTVVTLDEKHVLEVVVILLEREVELDEVGVDEMLVGKIDVVIVFVDEIDDLAL